MALELFWNWSAIGLTLLLSLTGAMALILPGRFAGRRAKGIGLDRHVEALLLVSFAATYAQGGLGNIPIWAGSGGVIAISLLGAIVPVILAMYFLLAAGPVRALASIPVIVLVSAAAFLTSSTEPGLGIISTPPDYYLPVIVAGIGGLVVGRFGLGSIPLAYAYGALGGLIGADLLRWEWLSTTPLTAASIGGADAQDLVFLLGLWGAAVAGAVNAPRLIKYERRPRPWPEVARLASHGQAHEAVEMALGQAHHALERWTHGRGLAHLPHDEVLTQSTARPVFEQVERVRASPQPWATDDVRQVLENLEGLTRRLSGSFPRHVAPRGQRVAAGLIDLVPVLVIAGFALWATSNLALTPLVNEAAGETALRTLVARLAFVFWVAVAAHVVIPLVVEWAAGGRSLGKAIVGLRVCRIDGSRATGWDHVVRNVARLVDILVLYLVPLLARPEKGRQRLGDHFAETYVASTHTAKPRRMSVASAPTAAPTTATTPSHEAMRPPL